MGLVGGPANLQASPSYHIAASPTKRSPSTTRTHRGTPPLLSWCRYWRKTKTQQNPGPTARGKPVSGVNRRPAAARRGGTTRQPQWHACARCVQAGKQPSLACFEGNREHGQFDGKGCKQNPPKIMRPSEKPSKNERTHTTTARYDRYMGKHASERARAARRGEDSGACPCLCRNTREQHVPG